MNTFDFSPLFRSTIGFDRLTRLLDDATNLEAAPGYPPYNIEKTGDSSYRITMAVAGFSEKELNIVAQPNLLVVSGRKEQEDKAEYLHRGIGTRAFERRFDLADYIRVRDASLRDGLLHIELVREVPEALKPRTVAISSKEPAKTIDAKAA
ncbi:MAG TPA: Hsp20 family protein [Candidatus Cybelea sp.]|nr:Hsp20 family protein [Candidatus Cybelea sp.]